jgi:hypothetical protein
VTEYTDGATAAAARTGSHHPITTQTAGRFGLQMIIATPSARPSAMGFGWMVVMTIAGGLAVVTST